MKAYAHPFPISHSHLNADKTKEHLPLPIHWPILARHLYNGQRILDKLDRKAHS